MAQSTQIKSVISVPIKDCIHHYPRALFNDIPESRRTFTTYPGRDALLQHTRVGTHFYDIPESGCTFTTYPGRDALLRHTRVGAQLNDIPGSLTFYLQDNELGRVAQTKFSECLTLSVHSIVYHSVLHGSHSKVIGKIKDFLITF